MPLTLEDKERLHAPLDLKTGHSLRIGSKSKKGAAKPWAQWLVYTEEFPVIERLNEVDLNWTWEINDKTIGSDWAVVYGTLTICGVSRSSNGDGGAHGEAPDGNMEKGAQTDALKRTARLFGVGEYLQNAPRIYTDWKDDPTRDEEAAFAKQAMAKFEAWYHQQFPPVKAAPKTTEPRTPIGRDPQPTSKADASAEPPDDADPMPMPTLDPAPAPTKKKAEKPAKETKQANAWATQMSISKMLEKARRNTWKDVPAIQSPKGVNYMGKALGFEVHSSFEELVYAVTHDFTGTEEDAWQMIQTFEPEHNDDLPQRQAEEDLPF